MNVDELLKALNISQTDYAYIEKKLKRKPNELELYLFSATYSEHCGYRHSKEYLKKLYRQNAVYTDENAGGITIGEHTICFKMESHNHPSAIEPFNGAATGIGGIIRDVLAMNARPIMLCDSLKFGNLKSNSTKHIFEGVVNGISAYGNCIGVPTIAGETDFDSKYKENPLVNVMALGIVKTDKIVTSHTHAGKLLMLIGSGTMKDGIGGAAFASKELSEDEAESSKFSIQIADPFMKKKLMEAMLEILSAGLADACQDCGAAGILSSTSEIALKSKCGVRLDLDKVHLGDTSMTPAEIMLSETQERMVIATERKSVEQIEKILAKYELESSIFGETTKEQYYRLYKDRKLIVDLPVKTLTDPPFIKVKPEKYTYKEIAPLTHDSIKTAKLKQNIYDFVANPCFASKEWVYSQYDYTVGNRTAIPPENKGCSALWLFEENCYIGIAVHSNPYQVAINPYRGAVNLICEARRKLIASGFKPLGYTNCLNFASPEKPRVIFQFSEVIQGLRDASKIFEIPVVSGNVSFYNEYHNSPILPTPTVGMIGVCEDFNAITNNHFDIDETVYLIGKNIKDDSKIGGSLYFKQIYNHLGEKIDKNDFSLEEKLENIVQELKKHNLLATCINVGKGGIFGAIFKGLIKNNLGFSGNLINASNPEISLFGEIQNQYLISTKETKLTEEFLNLYKIPYRQLGIVNGEEITFDEIIIEKEKAFNLYKNSINKCMN